jgi:hypothetical protein
VSKRRVRDFPSASSYALTVVLNFRNHRMIGSRPTRRLGTGNRKGTFTLVAAGVICADNIAA